MLLIMLLACTSGNPEIDTADTNPVFDCESDNNGVIVESELEAAFGSVSYLSNLSGDPVEVSPAGEQINGQTEWDFTDGPSGEITLEISDPSSAWYADSFPSADFAAPFSALAPELLAIFAYTDDGLVMQGLASTEQGESETLLVYDEPVLTYQLPLELGSTWTQEASFRDALIGGVANAGEEDYTFTVDDSGILTLGGYRFENTLRLRIDLEQRFAVTSGDPTVRSIRYIYLRECFGELVRIVSTAGEVSADFDEAAELTRLSF